MKAKKFMERGYAYLPDLKKQEFITECEKNDLNVTDLFRTGLQKQKEEGLIFGKSNFKGKKKRFEVRLTRKEKEYVSKSSKNMQISESVFIGTCVLIGKAELLGVG